MHTCLVVFFKRTHAAVLSAVQLTMGEGNIAIPHRKFWGMYPHPHGRRLWASDSLNLAVDRTALQAVATASEPRDT